MKRFFRWLFTMRHHRWLVNPDEDAYYAWADEWLDYVAEHGEDEKW
jgi:hypothetical protein